MRNFTIKDFEGAGQYLVRMSPPEIHCQKENKEFKGYVDTGYLSTIMYKIGYITNNFNIGNGNQLITLSSMADGWTRIGYYDEKEPDGSTKFDSKVFWQKDDDDRYGGKRKLIEYLNDEKLSSSEYRFATQEEVVRVVLSQNWRWRNK